MPQQAIAAAATGVTVTGSFVLPYEVFVSTSWATSKSISAKTTTSFTVTFTTPAPDPGGGTLDYLVLDAGIAQQGSGTTARSLIKAALRTLGIRIPTAEQEDNGLVTLNEMLAMWSAEGLMIPSRLEESFTLTKGTAVYTIGAGGTFDTTRPMKILAAFVRTADDLDYPVVVTMTLAEYHRVTDKDTQARPTRLYYATEFPLGKIHLDPNPDAADTLKLFSWKPLTRFATLDTATNLPDEYMKAIRLNLAADLAPEFSVALDSLTVQQAIGAHQAIRNLNRPAVGGARHDPALTRVLER